VLETGETHERQVPQNDAGDEFTEHTRLPGRVASSAPTLAAVRMTTSERPTDATGSLCPTGSVPPARAGSANRGSAKVTTARQASRTIRSTYRLPMWCGISCSLLVSHERLRCVCSRWRPDHRRRPMVASATTPLPILIDCQSALGNRSLRHKVPQSVPDVATRLPFHPCPFSQHQATRDGTEAQGERGKLRAGWPLFAEGRRLLPTRSPRQIVRSTRRTAPPARRCAGHGE